MKDRDRQKEDEERENQRKSDTVQEMTHFMRQWQTSKE